ncbi:MAG: MBOAT family protein [Leptospirales bacterium]|nr:MBOAT family protein [Leptospirales bacterium]
MLFNSILYFVFLLIVLLCYWALPHRARKWALLLASILFYLSWDWKFLLHFAFVLALNYPFFVQIYEKRSKAWLTLALLLNFLNLSFFKYFYFAAETTGRLLHDPSVLAIGLHKNSAFPEIILPLAISFYTFQLAAMHIDAYRGELPERPSFVNFSLFIIFFPQLIAGPIVRHNELLPHLDAPKDPDKIDVSRGLALIAVGIIKKAIIADYLAAPVAAITTQPLQYDAVSVFTACLFFGVQVYCDFSGYTDLARGSGLLLGFDFPVNFRGPFFALSFQDYWRRWHITLTNWLRDYLYISLGGSRVSEWRTYFNLSATFLLGGLWHGAGWGFALWGGFHGVALAVERALYRSGKLGQPAQWSLYPGETNPAFAVRTAYNVVKCFLLFSGMCLVGVFFNAGVDPDRGVDMLRAIFLAPGAKRFAFHSGHLATIALYLGLHFVEFNDYFPGSARYAKFSQIRLWWTAPAAILLLFYCSWKVGGDIPFVYFVF